MNKTLKALILIAAALAAVISPSLLIAQEASLSIRENSLFTNGVNLPASPQAWAMNRYGHQDINLYTGAAGYSIPIYTYSDNDFTLPLSIDYSSDGYRPNIQNATSPTTSMVISCTFMQTDPLAEKYYSLTPYAYCAGNPVRFYDPDGKDAIFITYPDYKADGFPLTGHSGVLLINNKTGYTKYYEYGRYRTPLGKVRNVSVHNVVIDADGKPTVSSLNEVFKQLSVGSGNSGDIEGAYIVSDEFDEMNNYAKELEKKGPSEDNKYSILTNNCASFASSVISHDESIEEPINIVDSPLVMVKQYQRKGDGSLHYDAKTKSRYL